MKICIAQTKSEKGNIKNNIENHKKWISMAISNKTDLIVFPELSLTSYEPGLAKALATDQNDPRLDEFQQISNLNKIAIAAGIPTKAKSGIFISMVIFQPNKPRQTYSKQKLHRDELPYFVEGNQQVVLTVKKIKIVPAICYESLRREHAKNACNLGAELYVASVAKSKDGVEKALVHFSKVAKKYSMPVLMANCIGYCDTIESIGKTSIWDENGILIGQLNNNSEGILIFDTKTKELLSSQA